jgi:RNA polymerase sigma-70 factor (ECF subfamily)
MYRVPAHQTQRAADPLSSDGALVPDLVRRARAAWPGVDVPRDEFLSHLRRCLPEGADGEAAVRQMRTNDLYLACACARRDAAAIAAFERHCLGVVDEVLSTMSGTCSALTNDVKQQLRVRLLVADADAPGILRFSGRGDLRHWVRVMAVREALVLVRGRQRELPTEEELLERAVLPVASPELEFLKRSCQHEFGAALTEAMSALSARDRTLLRQAFVDGLSIDQLGEFYRVHRATAARWLSRAQSSLKKETEDRLMRRWRVQPRELTSILRLVRSGLQISLRCIFPSRGRKVRGSVPRMTCGVGTPTPGDPKPA